MDPNPNILLQFAPKSVQPMVQAALQAQQERQTQAQAQLQAQQAMLEQDFAQAMARIDKNAENVPEEERNSRAFEHEYRRAKALREFDYMQQKTKLDAFGLPASEAEQYLRLNKDSLERKYGDLLKPFDQTEAYKGGKENWGKLQKNAESVGFLGSELKKGQQLLLEGKNILATSLFRQSVMKAVNSIVSPDAVQVGEMLIRYPQLLSATDQNLLKTNSIFKSAGPFVQKFLEKKEPILEEDKNRLIQALGNASVEDRKNLLQQIIDKANDPDPWTFYEIAANTFNGAVTNYNDMVQRQVIGPTSPRFAKQIGAYTFTPIETVSDLRAQTEQKAADQTLGSNTFTQPTIQGGAGQIAPAQQQSNVLNEPLKTPGSTLFRIKR